MPPPHHLLFLILPLLAQARPRPQFAGIGPWEGEFFGRDHGEEKHGISPYPRHNHRMAPGMAPPGYGYGQPDPYGYGLPACPHPQ